MQKGWPSASFGASGAGVGKGVAVGGAIAGALVGAGMAVEAGAGVWLQAFGWRDRQQRMAARERRPKRCAGLTGWITGR